jgi:hypothetical protein
VPNATNPAALHGCACFCAHQQVPNLISRKLKLFLIAGGVAALIATLASAIYTRADLANGTRKARRWSDFTFPTARHICVRDANFGLRKNNDHPADKPEIFAARN